MPPKKSKKVEEVKKPETTKAPASFQTAKLMEQLNELENQVKQLDTVKSDFISDMLPNITIKMIKIKATELVANHFNLKLTSDQLVQLAEKLN